MTFNYQKYLVFGIALFVIATALVPIGVFASTPTSYTPLAPLPDVTSEKLQLATSVDFNSYVRYAFNLLIALGAVAAVFMITWGGFEYMTTDAVQGKSEGLNKIQNAIYGLLLILSSYLILRTIDPRFVNISSTIVPPLNIKPAKTSLDWLSRLNSEISAYHIDQASARDTIAAAKQKQNELQQQGEIIANNISELAGLNDGDSIEIACASNEVSGTYDTSLAEACAEYTNNQNAQIQLQSSTTLFEREKVLDGYVEQCGTTGSLSSFDSTQNGSCYTNNLTAIDKYYTDNANGLEPNDLASFRNYAIYSKYVLSMDSYLSNFSQSLAAYNYNYFGIGTVTGTGWLVKVGTWVSKPFGTPAAAYTGMQLLQTQSLSAIESQLKEAQGKITDPTMYQKLASHAQNLKDQINSVTISQP
ncbi:MAG TPA: pilin [Candidatus Paceibacterota bacterium]|jgi:hypothetical protein|nr:pilin [Candidatus Paceibacterota bacterium]